MSLNASPSRQNDDLVQAIATACFGLVYISETDAPIEAFLRPGNHETPWAELMAALEKEFGTDSKEISVEEFFGRLTTEDDWNTPVQRRAAKKFHTLRKLLEKSLSDLHVFRFGRIRIEIVVAGRDANGNLAGIKTKSVET